METATCNNGEATGNVYVAAPRTLLHRAIYDYFRYLKDGQEASPAFAHPNKGTAAFVDINNNGTTNANTSSPTTDYSATVNRQNEKIQRVLNVMEEEFPEILSLPGERNNELEMRFMGYPHLEYRVRDLELCLQGRLSSSELNPPLPPAPLQSPQLTGTAATAATTAINAAANHLTKNEKKRRASFSHDDDIEIDGCGGEPSGAFTVAKKLKAQETEIKTLKTQLRVTKNKVEDLRRTGSNATTQTRGNGDKKKSSKKSAVTVDDLNDQREKALESMVSFEDRFEELVHWKNGYGHCRVPCTDKDHPGLARWVQTLRAAYKERQKRGKLYFGVLTDERVVQLEGLGFEWTVQAPKVSWETRFEQLKQFKEEHGHCRIVRSYPQNLALGEWCHRQRFLAHKDKLEEEKVKQLKCIGFELWVRKRGRSWDDHFSMLLEFRRQHQHLKVPPPDSRTKVKQVISTASEAGDSQEGEHENESIDTSKRDKSASEDGELGPPSLDSATEEYKEEQAFRRWVVAQRDNYHLKFQKGIKSTLTKARVKKLNNIGFDWTREGGENDLRRLRSGALHHRNDPEIWNRRFQEVVEYKRRFGDCNIPKEWPENKSLGAWCATQRKAYKALLTGERSSLTPERRSALESIGFTWIVRPARTSQKVLQIGGLQNAAMNLTRTRSPGPYLLDCQVHYR